MPRSRRPRYERVAVRPMEYHSPNVRRLLIALGAVVVVLVVGTLGYMAFGIDLIDSAYQTVTTVTTIGFREVSEFGTGLKIFTMVLALAGVGTVLYTLTLTLELLLEGQIGHVWGRRRMQRDIDAMEGHAVICGWGRVGRAAAEQIAQQGQPVVVIDHSDERLATCPHPHVMGDATDDAVLRQAGIRTARTLVACLDSDAGSVYAVLTARTLNPDLFVIARSRTDDSEAKFVRAGADRVVNPQRIGGNRIAAFAGSPDVVDFLDVVMHEGDHEFRLEDVEVHAGSSLVGATVADVRALEGGGALLLALRTGGRFVTNPPVDASFASGDVLIVVGTEKQVADLHRKAHP